MTWTAAPFTCRPGIVSGSCWRRKPPRRRSERPFRTICGGAADFIQRTGSWTGTATELLTAAAITGVQPNQFTRKLVEHFYTVFAPQGIRYQSRRTSNTRLLCFHL